MPCDRPRFRLYAVLASVAFFTVGAASCGASGGEGALGGSTTSTTALVEAPEITDPDEGVTTTTDGGKEGGSGNGDELTTTTEDDGGGGGPADEQAYVDALVTTFSAEDAETFSLEQIECLAEEWVAGVGVDAFDAAGVTPEDIVADEGGIEDLEIDEATAGGMADALGTCGVEIRSLFYEEFIGDEELTGEQTACLDATISDDDLRQFLVDSITGEDSGDEALAEAGTCLP